MLVIGIELETYEDITGKVSLSYLSRAPQMGEPSPSACP